MRLGRLFGVALVFVISVTAASAQSTGGLRIRIIDNSDKSPVIGASVTLSNTNKFVATTTLLSDVKGEVLFPVLRAGSGYVVQIIMDGYAGVRQDTKVDIGAMKDVVIAMAPEHIEKVTVIGEKLAAALVAQQRRVDQFFQPLQLQRDGGLGSPELPGGNGDAAGLNHRHE